MGVSVNQSTVAKYMRRHPRPTSQTWRTFLADHARQIMAVDLFVVPTVTFRMVFVLVILAHERRRIVHVASPTIPQPPGRRSSFAMPSQATRRPRISCMIAIRSSQEWQPPSPYEHPGDSNCAALALSFAFFASSQSNVLHRLDSIRCVPIRHTLASAEVVHTSVPKRGPKTIIRQPTPTKKPMKNGPEIIDFRPVL